MTKRRAFGVLACICIALLLSGCAKCVSVETSTVEVEIVDSYYKPQRVQPIMIGKTMSLITHPAKYRITVEYNEELYTFTGKHAYEKYSCQIGEMVSATMQVKTYDDGSIRYDIVDLK